MLLSGKTALVTGGASGIGLGIATQLAKAGADIVVASRRGEQCVAAAEQLAEKHSVKTLGVAMNVRDSTDVERGFQRVSDEFQRLDILVNNAAGNFYYPSHMLSDNQWKAIVETDLYGTFYCSRAAFPLLKECGGSITSISMTLHHTGWVGMAPACAAKSGVDALTRTLALEWSRHKVRVNAIAPGPIMTDGVRKAFAAGGGFSERELAVPLGRTGEPEEIGDLVVYLSSPAARWLTGEIICLDGGMHLDPSRGGLDPATLEQMARQASGKQLDSRAPGV